MSEPKNITIGNSYAWTISESKYKASDGWVVSYSLVNSAAQYSLASVANVDDHDVTITTTASLLYTAGEFSLVGVATKALEKKTIYSETLIIKPDPTSTFEIRTYAKQVLDAIEATILGKAAADTQSISVDGKSIARYTHTELLVLFDRFKRIVKEEEAARRASRNSSGGGIVRVRLN